MTENNTVASVQTAITMESSGYSAAQRKLLAENARFRASLKGMGVDVDALAAKGTRAGKVLSMAGHKPIAPWMASSAALRLTEGNITNNIRAAERFIATSRTMSSALQKAFPYIGALALAGVVGRLISRVNDFSKKVDAMPEKIRRGFDSLNLAAMSSNDSLAITNDKLDAQIAKLEGRPVNNLKTTLDEAREAADRLARKLSSANDEMRRLLAANSIGMEGSALTNKAETGSVEGSINSYNQQIADMGLKKALALQGGDTTGAAKIDQQIRSKQRSAIAWSQKRMGQLQWAQRWNKDTLGFMPDQSAKINDVQGFQLRMQLALGGETLTDQHLAKQSTLARLQEQARQKKAHDVAARKDATAARERQRTLDRTSEQFSRTIDARHPYVGSYYGKMAKIQAALAANDRMQIGRDTSVGRKMGTSMVYGTGTEASAARLEQSRNAIMNSSQGRQIADAADRIALMTGKITRLEYAQRRGARATQAYTQAMADYKQQLDQLANDPTLNLAQKNIALSRVSARMDSATAKYQIDTINNRAQQASLTGTSAVSGTVGSYFNDITDRAKFARGMTGSLLAGTNAGFSSMMIGNRGGWSNLFYGASGKAGQFAIGNVEKSMFSGLSKKGGVLGKAGGFMDKMFGGKGTPTGTKSNPMYVIDASSPAAKAASALAKLKMPIGNDLMATMPSSLQSLLGAGGKTGILGGILGGASKIAGLFAGGFASGGTIPTGKMALVGERGPELMYSGNGPHTVIPNHAIGGGGATYNIDARGTNPALVASYVQHAMQATHEQSVSQALALHHDNSRRRPK